MKILQTCVAAALLAVCLPPLANAGDVPSAEISKEMTKPVLESDYPYNKGVKDLELLDGVFISWEFSSLRRPSFDYELTILRIGWMLSDVKYSGWLRGNYEFLLEGFAGPFYQGPGTLQAGAAFMFRYNFVQPNSRLVPYFQLGGGGLYNDAYLHREQIEVGSEAEFSLQSTLGLSYVMGSKRNWAISGEFGYRHISDAETSTRNTGVNSLGGLLGLNYFF